jgi:hypothetical protein
MTASLHDPLDIACPVWTRPDLDGKINNANEELNRWLSYWDSFYGALREVESHCNKESDPAVSLGYGNDHLLRESRAFRTNNSRRLLTDSDIN